MNSFKISKKEEGKTVSSVILKKFPHLSKDSLLKAFRKHDIKINKVAVQRDFICSLGDELCIYIKDNILTGVFKELRVAYEDDNILVIYKPRGVISCGERDSFEEMVKSTICTTAVICHRLDTNTEGLVIFAKDGNAYAELISGFKNNCINKSYITLVNSKPQKDFDTLNAYILEDSKTSYSKVFDKPVLNSKDISTSYNLIQYLSKVDASILEVTIHTGRTHQIRAHMLHIGTPIIGDSKYTSMEINKKFKLKYQVLYAAKYSFNFNIDSPLSYLNNIVVDIEDEIIQTIKKLIKEN